MVLSKNSKYKGTRRQPPQCGRREKAAELTELDLSCPSDCTAGGQTAIGLSTVRSTACARGEFYCLQ